MAKTPVEFIIKALDGATPTLRAMTVRAHAFGNAIEKISNHKALQQMKGLGKALGVEQIGGALSNVGDAAGTVARRVGMLASIAGVAFVGLIVSAEAAGSRFDDTAKRLGTTVDWFASTEYAAKRAGIGTEEFTGGMDTLAKNLGAMTVGKGGKFLAFLQDVSPALARQVKGAKSTEQAFDLLTKALVKIEDPAKRARFSEKAFGSAKFGAWLHDGTMSLEQLRAEYIRLAGSQEESARRAGAMGDVFDQVEVSVLGLRQQLGGAFFPVLGKILTRLTEIVVSKRANIVAWAERAAAAIERWVASGGLERLIDGIGTVASVIGTVVEWLGPMGVAFAGAAVLAAPLIAALVGLAVSVGGFVVSLVAAGPAAVAIATALAAVVGVAALAVVSIAALGAGVYTVYKYWDDLVFIVKDWANTVRWAVLDTWEKIRPVVEKLSQFFAGGTWGVGFNAALSVGDSLRERLTPAAAREAAPAVSSSESRITVDIAGAPRGTRVSTESSGLQSIDVGVGYSMWGA